MMIKERTEPSPANAAVPSAASRESNSESKLETAFVAPLKSLRRGLEILRDFPDLPAVDRQRVAEASLQRCELIEQAVGDLGVGCFNAGPAAPASVEARFADRIKVMPDLGVIDVDFSDITFDSSEAVNAFFDVVDHLVVESRRKWWFLFNCRDQHVWPEAWVAHAHRSKKVSVGFALGLVSYVDRPGSQAAAAGEDLLPSREAALARVEELKAGRR